MPAPASTIKAERAHAQSMVISANLEQLATRVAEIDPDLRDDLVRYASRFDEYVRRLDAACDRKPISASRKDA
jgi:hypothetical protein